MKKTFLISVLSLLILIPATAQKLSGIVTGDEGSNQKAVSLPFATVIWLGENKGTSADLDGEFEIAAPKKYPATLVVSFVGYKSDTLVLNGKPQGGLKIHLQEAIALRTIEIEGKVRSTSVSHLEILHVEKIGSKELQKAACCNLSESFETNASVDAALTDAVSGSKKIRMLGLEGIYTQVLSENVPFLRGLSATEGLSHIPGPWVESIYITKGTGSVVNGYEAITGQINLEFLKPEDKEIDRYFLNLYANRMGRLEANLHTAQKMGEKWSTLFFGHISDISFETDNNGDGFLDSPLKRQYNVFNRWKYMGNRIRLQIGLRAFRDEVQGGQTGFNYDRDFGETERYGLGKTQQQVDIYTKTGYLFHNNPNASIGVIVNGRYHETDNYFGLRTYTANEKYFYSNAIYQRTLGNTRHLLKLGGSFLLDHIDQNFQDSTFSRKENVPGIFGEYTYSGGLSSLVIGNRFDFHNLYGLYIVPRAHYKYQLGETTYLRLSIGRGIRTANVYAENSSVLASSRQVLVLDDLQPEKAWNGGVTLSHDFKIAEKESFLAVDFFRTAFENQVVVDLEDPDFVKFYNLQGKSWSNSFQVETGIELFKRFDVKGAYKWYDVRTDFLDGTKTKPLVPTHRALGNLAYATAGEIWKFDLTTHWIGTTRIPSTSGNAEENERNNVSDAYTLFNAQVTRRFRKWEVYAGAENISGVRQENPIIDADNPFSTEFDASLVWAPINRQVFYAGMRLHF